MNTPNASVISSVFIAFQDNEESRPVVDAILADNAEAVATYPQGLVSRPGSASTCSSCTSTSSRFPATSTKTTTSFH